MNMVIAQAVVKQLKRSPKYNRKVKVHGILVTKRGCFIQVSDKATGRPFHIGDQHLRRS